MVFGCLWVQLNELGTQMMCVLGLGGLDGPRWISRIYQLFDSLKHKKMLPFAGEQQTNVGFLEQGYPSIAYKSAILDPI